MDTILQIVLGFVHSWKWVPVLFVSHNNDDSEAELGAFYIDSWTLLNVRITL